MAANILWSGVQQAATVTRNLSVFTELMNPG